ncbi:MAG: hypothetical protein J6S28_10775, partial [Clostridia bacterium]|nr:hypothetical protein [Clostridia bacterium]
MLDFCEVQHLKLNLSEALVARRNERKSSQRRFISHSEICSSLRQFCQKERKQFSHINKQGSCPR